MINSKYLADNQRILILETIWIIDFSGNVVPWKKSDHDDGSQDKTFEHKDMKDLTEAHVDDIKSSESKGKTPETEYQSLKGEISEGVEELEKDLIGENFIIFINWIFYIWKNITLNLICQCSAIEYCHRWFEEWLVISNYFVPADMIHNSFRIQSNN